MAKKTKAKTKKKTAKKKAVPKIKHKKKVVKKKKTAKKKRVPSKVNSGKNKKSVGKPSKYNISFDARAERYIARYGLNLVDMAKEFEVSQTLVYRWMKEQPTFAAAVEAGRRLMSSEIEHGLRQVAVPHDEVTDEYETEDLTDKETGEVVSSCRRGKQKIKRGVFNVNAALRLLQAGDERFRPNVKLDAKEAIDGLTTLLGEIDGTEQGLPSGG